MLISPQLTLDGDSYCSKHVIVYELYMELFLSLGRRLVQLQTFTSSSDLISRDVLVSPQLVLRLQPVTG